MLRELVMIGGGAALGALVPLAAGVHATARGAARPRPRVRALHPAPPHAPHPPLQAVYRPYHNFIGQSVYHDNIRTATALSRRGRQRLLF